MRHEELDARFRFDFKGGAGIKKAHSGELVLFNNSVEKNPEIDGVIHYCGQPTGPDPMQLIFGNKDLNDCWKDQERVIHMFKKNPVEGRFYAGRYRVVSEPYMANAEWRFPLRKLPPAQA